MIDPQNVAEHLRVAPVISPQWVWPSDPRVVQMQAAAALDVAE